MSTSRRILAPALLIFCLGMPGQIDPIRQAIQFDLDGKGTEARALIRQAIDSAPTPAAKAAAERTIAISWAFEGNCRAAGEYERRVIDYWRTREKEEPGNAFYQEGEMADEAGRICIDAGDIGAAESWYRMGRELGMAEPNIAPDRKALWDFRMEHAEARIAARRSDRAQAEKHIAAAREALDRMSQSRQQQAAFFPYLTGYVAFFLGDYQKALADLKQANQSDPFIQCLLGQTYEKLGAREAANECYRKAGATTAHNPPAAYARPFARRKLG